MNPFDAHGWTVFFYTDFRLQWEDLTAKVVKLKSRLDSKEFVTHPDVKLLKAIDSGIRDKISADPFANHFSLRKPLNKYGRLKKMGLPQRYRLFFRAFADQRVIIILWLGFPRKDGDRRDCYQVFSRMVASGKLPDSYDSLLAEFEDESVSDDGDDETDYLLSSPGNAAHLQRSIDELRQGKILEKELIDE